MTTTVMMPNTRVAATEQASLNRAQWLWRLALAFFMLATFVGVGWDRNWHATHPFESFLSPPHLFIYGTSVVAVGFTLLTLLLPDVRRWFGATLRLPPLPFAVPAALCLLLAGFTLQGMAGLVFDNFWHTHFGLDETAWSFPHAMIGCTFFLTVLGLTSCRLALRPYTPLPWYTKALLGFLLLGFSAGPFLGPMNGNRTPETVQAIASLPVLLRQPAFLHKLHVELAWNLTRTHTLFLLLSSLWAGMALTLVRRLDKRARIWLSLAFLWWVFSSTSEFGKVRGLENILHRTLLPDPAAWMPVPLFPVALVFALGLSLKLSERWAWLLAGWVCGILGLLIWHGQPFAGLAVLLCGPCAVLGCLIGSKIYQIAEKPAEHAAGWFVALAGFGMPFATGVVDLVLRRVTP